MSAVSASENLKRELAHVIGEHSGILRAISALEREALKSRERQGELIAQLACLERSDSFWGRIAERSASRGNPDDTDVIAELRASALRARLGVVSPAADAAPAKSDTFERLLAMFSDRRGLQNIELDFAPR